MHKIAGLEGVKTYGAIISGREQRKELLQPLALDVSDENKSRSRNKENETLLNPHFLSLSTKDIRSGSKAKYLTFPTAPWQCTDFSIQKSAT